jgi:hypothetical protein
MGTHKIQTIFPGLKFRCEVCGPQPAKAFYPGKYRLCRVHWNAEQKDYTRRMKERWG